MQRESRIVERIQIAGIGPGQEAYTGFAQQRQGGQRDFFDPVPRGDRFRRRLRGALPRASLGAADAGTDVGQFGSWL